MAEMSDKERFDAYMRLAEFRMSRRNERDQLGWRISLALWGLIVAAIYSIKTRPPESIMIAVLITVIVVHVGLWIWQIWVTNQFDQRSALEAVRTAQGILDAGMYGVGPLRYFLPFLWNWAVSVQIITTLLLAICAYFLIGSKFIR